MLSALDRGSSPHTRGARFIDKGSQFVYRIIPAYAGSTFPSLASTSARRDHPRIRGEHLSIERLRCVAAGSSPHTRGAQSPPMSRTLETRIIPAYAGSTHTTPTRHARQRDHPRIRGEHPDSVYHADKRTWIIPAYAGSTGGCGDGLGCLGDHPRIRGEHFRLDDRHQKIHGSSPHTRGAPGWEESCSAGGRIIPAYAGSTMRPTGSSSTKPDHPRIRGEHAGRRGLAGRRRRIIPAYAGSTSRWSAPSSRVPDHPRIRGEHSFEKLPSAMARGSSPHTRGALARALRLVHGARIIPAYAGSTMAGERLPVGRPDHPRIRGEHRKYQQDKAWRSGSSPHTRGARSFLSGPRRNRGIIPAYAGSTGCGCSPRAASKDHPRIRGEHAANPSLKKSSPGSSPHTRGARDRLVDVGFELGIIPAYAGSTIVIPHLRATLRDHPRIRGEHTWKSLQYQGSPP